MKRSHEIDMTQGPIFSKIVVFALPLMLTGILQLLFNAADVIVVGKFAGSRSLAAVGSNGALINLLVNVFVGISTGANVLVANFFGQRDSRGVERCVHCSMGLSAVMGVFVGVVGVFLSTPLLQMMNTDPDVLPLASLYLRIYFLGIPATVVYNFGAAILRAIGDTDRPLMFLLLSGVINVILNLLTVIVFKLDVAGVAIATAVSQYVAATLVVLCLVHSEGSYRLKIREIRIHKDMLALVVKIGIPAGLQSMIFSLSNVTIQSAINSFGYVTMAGNSAASNLDGFIYIAMNSVYHAALCFTSQNLGARRVDRLGKIFGSCVLLVILIGVAVTGVIYLLGPALLSLYISNADADRDAVIAVGMVRLTYVGLPYVLCGLMEVGSGVLRGLGRSWLPLIISVMGACVLRIIWVYTVFAANPTLETLYLSYPVSWFVTPLAHFTALFFVHRQLKKEHILA